MIKVKLLTDDSGHEYLVPNELVSEFNKDLEAEHLDFDAIWGVFRSDGSTQLYIAPKPATVAPCWTCLASGKIVEDADEPNIVVLKTCRDCNGTGQFRFEP